MFSPGKHLARICRTISKTHGWSSHSPFKPSISGCHRSDVQVCSPSCRFWSTSMACITRSEGAGKSANGWPRSPPKKDARFVLANRSSDWSSVASELQPYTPIKADTKQMQSSSMPTLHMRCKSWFQITCANGGRMPKLKRSVSPAPHS